MCCLFRYLKLIAISVFAIHFLPFLDSAEAQDDPINRDLWLENGKDQTVKIWSAQQSQKTAHYIRSLPAHREVENELRKILNPKFSVGPLSKVKNESMAIQHFLSDSRIFTISQKSLAEDAVIAMKDYAGVESGSASPSDLILNIPNLLLPNQQWSALGLECLLVQNICILQVHDGSHYSYIELNFSLKKVSSAEFNLPTQSIIPPKFVYISQDQVLSFSLIQGIDNNQAYESVELHDRGFLSKSKIHQISSVYDFLFATSDMSATSRSNILNRYFSGFFNSTGGYSLFLPEYFKFPFKVKSIHFSDKDPNVQMSVSEFDSSENVTSIGFHQDQLISLDARRHSIIATDPGTGQKMSEALINTWSESNSVIVDGAVLTQASVGIVSKLYITRLENGGT